MSVLDRSSLEASPLADLHTIASELSIDGYRRLRRAELITAIINKQGGEESDGADVSASAEADVPASAEADTPTSDGLDAPAPARRRASRSGGRRAAAAEPTERPAEETEAQAEPSEDAPAVKAPSASTPEAETQPERPAAGDSDEDDDRSGPRRRRGRRGGRGRSAAREENGAHAEAPVAARSGADEAGTEDDEEESAEEGLVDGVVELLANGSGFVRVEPPDPSDDDVYISSAQVKRCELVSGDRVAGPKRAPRRSERFASMIRIETINGRPASELADGVRFDDLPAAYPDQRLKIGSEDPTLKAIEWLTPFGKGSRVTIVGPPRSGKTEALRRLAVALADREDLVLTVVLAGVRPEEISAWNQGPAVPVAAVSFAASEDGRNSAIEPVIEQARRLAARGTDAVVLIDTLDGSSPQTARKALAAARNIVDGGSLTVIATAAEPIGGETTVIALDVTLASIGRFPALDIMASGTLRPELLVGEAGAEAIARTRAEVSEGSADG